MTMKAIEIVDQELRLIQTAKPIPGSDEVLIAVKAAGVNRADVLQRKGVYPPPAGASEVPGLEVAGVIEETGEKVCALLVSGGYAEYCVAPKQQILPIPEGLSFAEAAALPETFFTVWTNVFQSGGLKSGETFLVHGGGSGIGTTAIQLAVAHGCRVFTTAGTDEKCKQCEAIGASQAINYNTEDFVTVIKKETDGKGVDVILDMVGGDYIQRNLQCLAQKGRHVSIGFQKGAEVEVNFLPIMQKRLLLTGSTLRPRSTEEKGAIAQQLHKYVWPLLEQGTVKPIIDSTFPLEDAASALAKMEAGDHFGKIVLTMELIIRQRDNCIMRLCV